MGYAIRKKIKPFVNRKKHNKLLYSPHTAFKAEETESTLFLYVRLRIFKYSIVLYPINVLLYLNIGRRMSCNKWPGANSWLISVYYHIFNTFISVGWALASIYLSKTSILFTTRVIRNKLAPSIFITLRSTLVAYLIFFFSLDFSFPK